ncbi:MAG: Tfp pilus assembly protein FimT/FimU [Phycisphaerae bacterium]
MWNGHANLVTAALSQWAREYRVPRSPFRIRSGFTLLEMLLVIGMLVVLTGLVMPNFIGELESRRLPSSAEQMRALLTMTRANAMFDGKRYRLRLPRKDELDAMGDDRHPIIEREDDPVAEPEVFNRVTAPWTFGETFARGVWCIQVRLGRPELDDAVLSGERSKEMAEQLFDDEDPQYPPLIVEPDGTSEWATFVLTSVEPDTDVDELEDTDPVIDVIMDGMTGLIWLQRPFRDEEIEMLRENNWPPVLRQDFLRSESLTEKDVMEIRERLIRR